jgi:hypothetical protein
MPPTGQAKGVGSLYELLSMCLGAAVGAVAGRSGGHCCLVTGRASQLAWLSRKQPRAFAILVNPAEGGLVEIAKTGREGGLRTAGGGPGR